jgi:enoyl-CoA hydratase/carnithine racemase
MSVEHPRNYQRIKVERGGGVETITLFYPERRNAIGPVMVNELLYAIDDARAVHEVAAIVITGDGKAFCAGGDFGAMPGGSHAPGQHEGGLLHKGDYAALLLMMVNSDKPIIAKVNGAAMGGGLGLVAASTFAIASTEATLGTPEINVGLFPMMIMAVLQRLIPRRRLVEMMLLGEKMSAEEAQRLGLLNRVVTPGELDDAVVALVAKIVDKSPIAIAMGLKAIAEQDDLDLEAALPLLRGKLGEILATDDAREGLTAFLEKRKPVWKGK